MVIATAILACLAILADAHTTQACLLRGRVEGHRFRSFLIRMLGVNGGTYGVAVVYGAVIVLVNVYALDDRLGLIIGNLMIAAGFWWAAWHNSRIA